MNNTRKSTKIPAVYPTKKGDWYCSCNGRKIYVGRNKRDAKKRARELARGIEPKKATATISEPIATEQPPAPMQPEPAPAPVQRKTVRTITPSGPTVAELILAYMPTATADRSHFHSIRTALRIMAERYGETSAADFGPLALKDCRQQMVAADLARTYVNKLTGYIVRLFKWAVANEILPESTASRLTYVQPLKRGEARETIAREEVPDVEILKTLPHLLPTIRDMVVLQRISGMRPSELFRMTLAQFVQRTPSAWIYCPFYHKTSIHNKTRVIGFGIYEIAILQRHAKGKGPDDPLFSPRDTRREIAEKFGTDRAPGNPNVSATYCKDSYCKNITKTIKRVNESLRRDGAPESEFIQHWTPYQLRHATATFLSLLLDPEAAATALGHATTQTTQRYDHSQIFKTIQLLQERDEAAKEDLEILVAKTKQAAWQQ